MVRPDRLLTSYLRCALGQHQPIASSTSPSSSSAIIILIFIIIIILLFHWTFRCNFKFHCELYISFVFRLLYFYLCTTALCVKPLGNGILRIKQNNHLGLHFFSVELFQTKIYGHLFVTVSLLIYFWKFCTNEKKRLKCCWLNMNLQ